jgi:hypothetical protein
LETIGNARSAIGIIAAGTAVAVEEAAGNIGRQDSAIVCVLKLDEATTATAIAQTFPLGIVEFAKRFEAPERRGRCFCH